MEEAEATEGRGGEAEDTVGKGTEEVTARRAEKKQKSQKRNHERYPRRGEDRRQKDTYVTEPPERKHQSASDEKDEISPNETKDKTKTTGEEEKKGRGRR